MTRPTGPGQRYVECPGCQVRYPARKLYGQSHDRPEPGKVYTVVCAVCGLQFDTSFQKRRFPASLLKGGLRAFLPQVGPEPRGKG